MASVTRIGIIGDFDASNPTHIATSNSIQHAAQALSEPFEASWLPTDQPHDFGNIQGLLCSPGSPYKSLDGALTAIRYARENKIPFLGTCGGFQHLAIEFARNVLGFVDAAHAESDPYASCLFITPLSCSLVGMTMAVDLKPESKAAVVCQTTRLTEKFYCNFGLNPQYQQRLTTAGLQITGTDPNGEARILELINHPFFVGTLFVPQAKSEVGKPHPLILEFCRISASATS